MILYRVYIKEKKVINRAYWFDSATESADMKREKDKILAKFPDETWPWNPFIIGYDMDANVMTVHQCSVDSDFEGSTGNKAHIQNNLLLDKDFMRYIYDLDNTKKTIEVFYKQGSVVSPVTLGDKVRIYRVSEMYNSDWSKQEGKRLYVMPANESDGLETGEKISDWIDTLATNETEYLTMPITKTKHLHPDDSFMIPLDKDNKVNGKIELFAHVDRAAVFGMDDKVHVEYSADYGDEITNRDNTEIVIPKYDSRNNRIKSTEDKSQIGEYIFVPKDDGSGGYTKVKMADQ